MTTQHAVIIYGMLMLLGIGFALGRIYQACEEEKGE